MALPRAVVAPLSPHWAQLLGGATLFLLFTRISDLYRPAHWPVSLNQFLVAIVVLTLLLRRRRLIFDRRLGWMLAYGAAIGLSSLVAVDRLAALAAMLAYVHDVVIVFIIVNIVTSARELRLATWIVVSAGSCVAGLSLFRMTTGIDLGTLAMVDFGNLAGAEVGYRLAGTIGNSNAFAQMLACALPLALYRVWGESSRWVRLAALGAVVLMTSVLILTYSRGGGIAFLISVIVALALRRFKPSNVLTVALVLGVASILTPSTYWNRLTVTAGYIADSGGRSTRDGAVPGQTESAVQVGPTGSTLDSGGADVAVIPAATATVPGKPPRDAGSLPERLLLWRVGLLMFRDHPLLGVGKNNYFLQYPAYAAQVDSSLLADPKVVHSTPIQILADTGLIGFLAFVALLIVVLGSVESARRGYSREGREAATLLIEPLAVGICAYVASSLFQSDDYPRFLWLLLGLAIAACRLRATPAPMAGKPADQPALPPRNISSTGGLRMT